MGAELQHAYATIFNIKQNIELSDQKIAFSVMETFAGLGLELGIYIRIHMRICIPYRIFILNGGI